MCGFEGVTGNWSDILTGIIDENPLASTDEPNNSQMSMGPVIFVAVIAAVAVGSIVFLRRMKH